MIIWVVEKRNEKGVWVPTVGCGLSRKDAIREMGNYRMFNHQDCKFRVKKYLQC
jgi:hypothetical protein